MATNESDKLVMNSVMTTVMLTCEWCKQEFPKAKKMARFCSMKCNVSYNNELTRLKNQEDFLKEHGNDPLMPVCKECGWKAFDLITHITKFHKIPLKQYRLKWKADTTDISHPNHTQKKRERVEGEKNPGYQHGGTMSSVSKNFKKYEGMDENKKQEQINKVKQKQASSRDNGGGYTNRLKYWLNKGYTREDARKKLAERQTTFSLSKCIDMYGEKEGERIWQARQDKWLATMRSKSPEELIEINKKKMAGMKRAWSYIGLEFFESIQCDDAIYADPCRDEFVVCLEGRVIRPDFVLGNKIIEFNGDCFHANPDIYGPNDIPIPYINKTALDIWKYEDERLSLLERNGYKVLVVWETDYRTNPEKTIELARAFLGLTNNIETEVVKEHD